MTLVEKQERLAELNKEVAAKTKEKEQLLVVVKDASTDEEIEDAKKKLEEVSEVLDGLKSEQEETATEVADEEAANENAGQGEEKKMAENKTVINKSVDYVNTKEAMDDFVNVLQKHAGEDSQEVVKALKAVQVEKGIKNPEVLLPTPVMTAITDAFDKSEILSSIQKTGLTALKVAVNINYTDTSRAHGHKAGTDKKEQEIILATKEIRAQYIYKYITIDKEILRQNDNGAILNYILGELPIQIVNELERAIVIGDDRGNGDEDKIDKIQALVSGSLTDNIATHEFLETTPIRATKGNEIDGLVDMDAAVTASGERILVVKRSFLATLRKMKDNTGALMFPLGTDIASALGFDKIVAPSWMEKASQEAVLFAAGGYKLVGDLGIESYDNFLLAKNKHEYLAEIYVGGGITERATAAMLTVVAAPSK